MTKVHLTSRIDHIRHQIFFESVFRLLEISSKNYSLALSWNIFLNCLCF